jgi:hypothetical protein
MWVACALCCRAATGARAPPARLGVRTRALVAQKVEHSAFQIFLSFLSFVRTRALVAGTAMPGGTAYVPRVLGR